MHKFFKTTLFSALMTLLCLVATASLSQRDQKPPSISSVANRFEIAFPTDPVAKEQELLVQDTKLIYQELAATSQGMLYTVSYVDFPSVWKFFGAKKILTKTFEEFVKYEKGIEKVSFQELGNHSGFPALSYKLIQEGKEVEGKLVVAGYTLYKVSIATPLQVAGTIDKSSFFDSFQLRHAGPTPNLKS